MNDMVEELRANFKTEPMALEAADDLERLRAEHNALADDCRDELNCLNAEIERLRAALRQVANQFDADTCGCGRIARQALEGK